MTVRCASSLKHQSIGARAPVSQKRRTCWDGAFLPFKIPSQTFQCKSGSEKYEDAQIISASGGKELPTQGDAMVAGVDPIDYVNQQLQDILRPRDTEDYLAVCHLIINMSCERVV